MDRKQNKIQQSFKLTQNIRYQFSFPFILTTSENSTAVDSGSKYSSALRGRHGADVADWNSAETKGEHSEGKRMAKLCPDSRIVKLQCSLSSAHGRYFYDCPIERMHSSNGHRKVPENGEECERKERVPLALSAHVFFGRWSTSRAQCPTEFYD